MQSRYTKAIMKEIDEIRSINASIQDEGLRRENEEYILCLQHRLHSSKLSPPISNIVVTHMSRGCKLYKELRRSLMT